MSAERQRRRCSPRAPRRATAATSSRTGRRRRRRRPAPASSHEPTRSRALVTGSVLYGASPCRTGHRLRAVLPPHGRRRRRRLAPSHCRPDATSSSSAPVPPGSPPPTSSASAGRTCDVLEATDVVGGISQTVERDGWRFDIGGHRFFTKVPEVEALWHEILPDEDFMQRPRASRIYYQGKFFDYPLKPFNALRTLGLVEAIRCVLSFLWVRVRPPKDQTHARGLRRRQLRLAPLRPLLQDLQHEGLGGPAVGDLRRVGRPAHQGHVARGPRCGSRSALASPAAGARASRSPASSRSSSTRSTAPG